MADGLIAPTRPLVGRRRIYYPILHLSRNIDPSIHHNPSFPTFLNATRKKENTLSLGTIACQNVACEEIGLRNLLPTQLSFRMAEGYEHTGHQFR
jgi:hypothetical protein